MGGGTSKVDPYIIHIDLGKPDDKNDDKLETLRLFEPKIKAVVALEKAKSSTGLLDKRKQLITSSGKMKSVTDLNKVRNGASVKRNTTSVVCSESHPWLLKNAKLHGSLSDFEFGRIIGRGLMGTVRLVKTKNDKYVVFKSMRKDAVVKHNDQRHVESEKHVLNSLNCSFCIKLFGTFQDKHCLYLALEFAPGGELFHRLGKKKYFPPDVAKFYISEIFVALEHVQSLGFVYRDLKPENVLLDEEGHCKLVDFGFSTAVSLTTGKMHTLCGTPAYLSPEQLDGKFTDGYTKIVDWWSFGVLIYELRTGKTPFCRHHSDSHYEIFLRVLKKRISFPLFFDSSSKELIASLCHPDLAKRLSLPENIKKHPYFGLSWAAVAARRLVPPFVPRIKEVGDCHYFDKYHEPSAAPSDSVGEHKDPRNEFSDF